MYVGRGGFRVTPKQKLQIGDQPLFGGCQSSFWRVPICILEAEIVLGGGALDPRKRGYVACPPRRSENPRTQVGEKVGFGRP